MTRIGSRIAWLVPALVAATVVAGCNGGSKTSARAATAAPVTSGTTGTPVTDVHGELVSVPALAGGAALAFQVDGAAAPLEVVDPAALLAAGLHEGFTLVVSGEERPNAGGRTGLAGAVSVTAFAKDDLVTGGRLKPGFPGVAFEDVRGRAFVPDGPLAAALLASPLDRPLFVTGRVDTTRPPTQVGEFLIVTSWRPAVTLAWTDNKPLLGHDAFTIDDLEGTGHYRTDSFMVGFASGNLEVRGSGRRLPASVLADLQGRVQAANLRALPSTFQPPQIYPDHPSTTLRYADAQGDVSITIWAGASVPPALGALVQGLAALPATVPTRRSIDRGDQSQITTAGVEVARDLSAWGSLFARHVYPGKPALPAIDFATEVGVGAFDGQRPSGGYAIEVTDVTKIGPHLHLTIERTTPSGPAPTVLTAPYHFVAVSLTGAPGADLYADGARLP